MNNQNNPNLDGKRMGIHPLIVIFGVIIGLWLFIQFIIPKSKSPRPNPNLTTTMPASEVPEEIDPTLVPVFQVASVIPETNAISILVPPQTTESQVVALLYHFRQTQHDGTLSTLLPPTTPANELGPFAIADIYIFSDENIAVPDAVKVLSRGANAPGEFYPSSIPFEVAMEHVRGHYTINLNTPEAPEHGSLGFGEEATGVYSKEYKLLF